MTSPEAVFPDHGARGDKRADVQRANRAGESVLRANSAGAQRMKGAAMLRTLIGFFRFYNNYRYFRRSGLHARYAWRLAKATLPD